MKNGDVSNLFDNVSELQNIDTTGWTTDEMLKQVEIEKKKEGICRGCTHAFCVNPYAMIYYCDALKTTKRGEESCELFERRGKE